MDWLCKENGCSRTQDHIVRPIISNWHGLLMWVLQTIIHFTGAVILGEISFLNSSDYPESPTSPSLSGQIMNLVDWPSGGPRATHSCWDTGTMMDTYAFCTEKRWKSPKQLNCQNGVVGNQKALSSTENYSSLQRTSADLVFQSYFLTYFWHSKTLGK